MKQQIDARGMGEVEVELAKEVDPASHRLVVYFSLCDCTVASEHGWPRSVACASCSTQLMAKPDVMIDFLHPSFWPIYHLCFAE